MRTKHGLRLAILMALAAPAWPQAAASPDTSMGAALHQERVTGDLRKAIEGYRKVLAAKGISRAQAAQAQYHIGICYEKLGNQEARKAFESVVRDYADQKDLVMQARARLAAIGVPGGGGGIRTRLLWDNAIDVWGRASADGRYFSFVDWSSCDLGVRDLASGENRKLTNHGCDNRDVEASAISPDGKRIAFGSRFFDTRPTRATLSVIGIDGKNEKVLLEGDGLSYVEPHSWSSDGKWIAAAGTACTAWTWPAARLRG